MESDVDKLLKGQLEMQGPRDNTVRVYLMSTFMDMEVERQALHTKVFPKVRSLCREKGLEFQVVDLGCSRTTSWEQYELDICAPLCEPIAMVLMGERYGPIRPPTTISAKEFKMLKKTALELAQNASRFLQTLRQVLLPPLFDELVASGGDIHTEYLANIELLQSLYRKDTNSVPPSYVLNDESERNYNPSSSSEDKMQIFLCTVVTAAYEDGHLSGEAKEKYFQSAFGTLLSSILNPPKPGSVQKPHVVCVKRKLNGLQELIQNNPTETCGRYVDLVKMKESCCVDSSLQERLQDLSKRVVSPGSTLCYAVDWSNEGVTTTVPDYKQYLEKMCEDAEKILIGLVNKCEEQCKEPCPPGNRLLREIRHHGTMNHRLTGPFCGQNGVLLEVQQKIRTCRLPVVIHGASGCGKTCLIRKILELFPEWVGSDCIRIVRFLGTSELSRDLKSTLNSICDQLSRLLNAELDLKTTSDIPDTLDCILSLGAKISKPCLVALDAINELSPAYASSVLCLLSQNLPENLKFVISVTSDADLSNPNIWWEHITWKFHHANQCIEVPSFSTESSLHVLNQHLKHSQRCLTAYQRDRLVSSFSQCPTPLFIKLAIEEACLWASHTQLGQFPMDQAFSSLLDRVFLRLEEAHGKVLVSRTCAYIASSRSGLSCMELEDILSLDDGVLQEVFAGSPPLHRDMVRMPSLRLKQLLQDLQPFLSATEESGCALLTWSHKSVEKIIKEQYVNPKDLIQNRAVHKRMAEYWIGLYGSDDRRPLQLTVDGKELALSLEVREVTHRPSGLNNNVCNVRKLVELPSHLLQAGEIESFNNRLLNLDWVVSKCGIVSTESVISDLQLASALQPNRGYLEIAKALIECADAGTRTHFVKQLQFHLLPSSQKYPETVGKLIREIEMQTSSEGERTFICCSGLQSTDHQPKSDHNSASDVDPSLQNLAYNSERGIIAGLTTDGRIASMNLAQKTCSWSYFPFKSDLSESSCILSKDASKLVVFGCKLAVVDMVQKTTILVLEASSNQLGALGRYVKAAISKDNRRIVAEESVDPGSSLLHVVDLSAADQKYPCLPGLIHFTENRVIFGTKRAGTSSSDRFCLMMEVMLSKDGPTRQLCLENQVQEFNILCMSPAEEQIAVISLEAYSGEGKKNRRQLTLKLFATKQDKLIRSYQSDLEQNLDCELNDMRARFLTSCIILFTSSSTWKLDLVTGILTEMLSFALTNPIISTDGSCVAGVVKKMGSSNLCIVDTETAGIVVDYFIPTGIGLDFLASSKLDTFLFFVRGMSLPVVFVANKSLRKSLNVDEDGFNIPLFSTSPWPHSPDQETQDNSPDIVIERISPTMLTGHPSIRPKTSRGQNDSGDLNSSSMMNSSGEGIQMIAVHRDNSPEHLGERLEEKAYFAKAPQTKRQLMRDNTATIRLRKMNFDHTEVTEANSAAPVLVSFKEDAPADDLREGVGGTVSAPVDEQSRGPNAVNRNADDESVVTSSSWSGSYSESDEVDEDAPNNPGEESKTRSDIDNRTQEHQETERHENSFGSGTYESGSTQSGSEFDSGSFTTGASESGSEDPSKNCTETKEDILGGNRVEFTNEKTDNEPDTTQSTTEVSDFRANYFISSESEEDYDGGVEDNTITEGEMYEDSKTSGEYDQIRAGHVVRAGPSDPQLQRRGGDIPMDTTSDESEEDWTIQRSEQDTTPRRLVLLRRKSTANNFFLSDDDEDSPETVEPVQDRPNNAVREHATANSVHKSPDRVMEGETSPDSDASSLRSEEGKSKTCSIM